MRWRVNFEHRYSVNLMGFEQSSASGWIAAAIAASKSPCAPSKLTAQYTDRVFERLTKRQTLSVRVDASTAGRTIPDLDQLAIGEGKHFDHLSILFLDICNFSSLGNRDLNEQKSVLKMLNIFMGEMLTVIRDYGGIFEKNTGDGLMAYFGEGARSAEEASKPAVEAAVAMHYVNDHLLPHFLKKEGCVPVTFRVGIDTGPVTLAKVAIHGGTHGSMLAVGTTANIACKLMALIPEGGISVGEKTYEVLPNNWQQSCELLDGNTKHTYRITNIAYRGWKLNYRANWTGFPT
jgi:adenylate cyclase